MKKALILTVAALTLCLAVTSVGWFQATRTQPSSERLGCHFDSGILVLNYTYGSNEVVSTDFDIREGKVVVSVSRENGGGGSLSPLYLGEARYSSVEPGTPVTYPDGGRLACPLRSPT